MILCDRNSYKLCCLFMTKNYLIVYISIVHYNWFSDEIYKGFLHMLVHGVTINNRERELLFTILQKSANREDLWKGTNKPH